MATVLSRLNRRGVYEVKAYPHTGGGCPGIGTLSQSVSLSVQVLLVQTLKIKTRERITLLQIYIPRVVLTMSVVQTINSRYINKQKLDNLLRALFPSGDYECEVRTMYTSEHSKKAH